MEVEVKTTRVDVDVTRGQRINMFFRKQKRVWICLGGKLVYGARPDNEFVLGYLTGYWNFRFLFTGKFNRERAQQ